MLDDQKQQYIKMTDMVAQISPILPDRFKATFTAIASCAVILGTVVRGQGAAMAETVAVDSSDNDMLAFVNKTYVFAGPESADPINQGYVIFRHQDQQVVGAFYYPQSEYSCFVGDLKGQHLDVTTFDPYSHLPASANVALSSLAQVQNIGVHENRILDNCQQDIAELQGQWSITNLPQQ